MPRGMSPVRSKNQEVNAMRKGAILGINSHSIRRYAIERYNDSKMIPKRNKKQRRNGIYEKDKEG